MKKYVKIILKRELNLFNLDNLNNYELELFLSYFRAMYLYDCTGDFIYRENAKKYLNKYELYKYIKI